MILSMSTCSTEREKLPDGGYHFDAIDALRQCAAAGFTHIDFNLAQAAKENRPLSGEDWKCWIHSVRETADSLHLTVSQTHAHWFWLRDMRSEEELNWNESMVLRSIEATAMLGKGLWTVTHPRTVYDGEGYHPQKTLEYNYRHLSEQGELAARLGVGLAIENLPPLANKIDYCWQTEELLALREKLNDPVFGICWDFGHANCAQLDHEKALEEIAPHLKVLHVHDNKAKGDNHFPPYFGNVPWPRIMPKLKEVGYNGTFNFEVQVYFLSLPRELREEGLRFLHSTGEQLLRLYDER